MQAQKILNQAIEHHKAGNLKQAEQLYSQLFQQNRNNQNVLMVLSQAYNSLGNSYWDNGDLKAAADSYLKAIRNSPRNFEAYNNLAMLYADQKMFQDAIANYEKAIKINPNIAEIHNNLGTVFFDIGEIEKAIKCHEQALKLNPNYAEAYYNLGNDYKGNIKYKLHLQDPEKLEKAQANYEKAIELRPDFANAYMNLGLIYHYKNEPEKELLFYQKAEQLAPNSPDVLNNIGNMHRDAARLEQAIEYFEKAVRIDPNHTDSYVNASISYLALKNFDKGWQYYQYRLVDDIRCQQKIREYKQPVWSGQSLEGKTIYVYYEQGFGDTINFVRFLPVLHDMGAKVLFQPQKELVDLFKLNDIKAELVEDPSGFDYHVPLLSIPGVLGVNYENIPSSSAYLKADPEKVKFYRENYFNNDSFKIGINWQCQNLLHVQQFRSLPHISYIHSLLEFENTKIYSFQKGCGTDQLENLPDGIEVVDLGETFNSFADTAAALEGIDLLISVDTSVPHLAGALGKQAWVLMQKVPDFRWSLEGENTPWYDSLRIFRQKVPDQWEEVIERVHQELSSLL